MSQIPCDQVHHQPILEEGSKIPEILSDFLKNKYPVGGTAGIGT